jgi:hypothetical protein
MIGKTFHPPARWRSLEGQYRMTLAAFDTGERKCVGKFSELASSPDVSSESLPTLNPLRRHWRRLSRRESEVIHHEPRTKN